MRKTIIFILLIGGGVFGHLTATEKDKDISLSGGVGYESEDVSRASKQSGPALQGSLQLNYETANGEIYVGSWNNYPFSRKTLVAVESDPYFGYQHNLGEVFYADFGYIYNWKVNPPASVLGHSNEVYVGVSGDVMLTPKVYGYYDLDKRQWTLESAIGYSFDLNELGAPNTSLDVGLLVGILRAKSAYGPLRPRRNGYAYFGTTADIVYHFNDVFCFKIGIRYAANNDKPTGVANDIGHHKKMFWYGTGLFAQY
ncbi:MAG: hypothetical protein A2007_05075 [Verrucomicrobia bacterium GWC2_42_7]|nr:MAG: hypothetical protein A2007_05075 [Verrucomicrobia bacterium GWC2_42_7]